MKLKNKKTGEIVEHIWFDPILDKLCVNGKSMTFYGSLTELNAEWEDAPEEPKEYWYIDWTPEIGVYHTRDVASDADEQQKEIGNYFETKEEAEKAVEKLKAWKRLKDKGFEFCGWCEDIGFRFTKSGAWQTEVRPDLDLLFGGEE